MPKHRLWEKKKKISLEIYRSAQTGSSQGCFYEHLKQKKKGKEKKERKSILKCHLVEKIIFTYLFYGEKENYAKAWIDLFGFFEFPSHS